ncbi:P-II family nitrogen regulator [Rhodoblastus sp.]|uniref:P-II family nitrogen regulator n=1 Tax=Rhodoblastus sp. TaxID=1962975 RepID=UPI003F9C1260
MKLVIAIVKPFKVDPIQTALSEMGVVGMTVSEAQGYGRQKGHKEIYRGAEYVIKTIPKMKIEVAIPADRLDAVVEAIMRIARTGEVGDGKIFVLDIERVYRIRTGETDQAAL